MSLVAEHYREAVAKSPNLAKCLEACLSPRNEAELHNRACELIFNLCRKTETCTAKDSTKCASHRRRRVLLQSNLVDCLFRVHDTTPNPFLRRSAMFALLELVVDSPSMYTEAARIHARISNVLFEGPQLHPLYCSYLTQILQAVEPHISKGETTPRRVKARREETPSKILPKDHAEPLSRAQRKDVVNHYLNIQARQESGQGTVSQKILMAQQRRGLTMSTPVRVTRADQKTKKSSPPTSIARPAGCGLHAAV